MKKLIIVLTALLTMTVSANAMSYEQARNEALFLTDKMAYELNLTDDQYEAAYEVNLDYLMSVDNYDDLYGSYWNRRNIDLGYILYDWQFNMFCNASYFYRPLYWGGGYWHFGIYARYPHRDYYYFGRPDFYGSYRGGHSWGYNGGRSFYAGRSFGRENDGMRDGYNRGEYRTGTFNHSSFGNGTRNGNYGTRNSSFGNGSRNGNYGNNGNGSFGNGSRNGNYGNNGNNDSQSRNYNRGFGSSNSRFGHESSTRTTVTRGSSSDTNSSSFGGSRFGGSRDIFSNGSNSGSFRSSGTTPTSRSFSTPTRSSSSSFGGGSSNFSSGSSSFGGSRGGSSSSSFGGGSHSSFGGGSHSGGGSFGGSSSGGGHFGGGRR